MNNTKKPKESKVKTELKYYINNAKFMELLKEYHAQKTNPKIISEDLGDIFLLLVNNIAFSRNFINYSDDWKNEMKSDALYFCCKYIDKFDIKKYDNPYGYFTMIAFNAFKMRIKKEKTQNFKDNKLREEIFDEFLYEEGIYKRKIVDIEDEDNRIFQEMDNMRSSIEEMLKENEEMGKETETVEES